MGSLAGLETRAPGFQPPSWHCSGKGPCARKSARASLTFDHTGCSRVCPGGLRASALFSAQHSSLRCQVSQPSPTAASALMSPSQ